MFIYNLRINGGIALKIIIIMLSIFMLIVFGISLYRIFFLGSKFEVNDRISVKEITEINSDSYTNILKAVHDDLDSYIGIKIKFTGYIYRLFDFNKEQFVIARDMFINDTKTQTVVVGFLCQYKNAEEFKDGEWVELIGSVERGKYHNKEIPIIKIVEIKPTSEPESVFVMPPSDTYLPTSGLI